MHLELNCKRKNKQKTVPLLVDHAKGMEKGGVGDGFGFGLLFEVFFGTAVIGEPELFDSHCTDSGGKTVDFGLGPELERVC